METGLKVEAEQTSEKLLVTPIMKKRSSLLSKLNYCHPMDKVMRSFSRQAQAPANELTISEKNQKVISGTSQIYL